VIVIFLERVEDIRLLNAFIESMGHFPRLLSVGDVVRFVVITGGEIGIGSETAKPDTGGRSLDGLMEKMAEVYIEFLQGIKKRRSNEESSDKNL